MEFISQDWHLSCSPAELYTLASLLGGETLIGLPDPFPGWLTEEIQAAMDEARQSLMARGVLAPRGDGETVMDVVAAALIGTLIAPQTAFILTLTVPDQPPYQINIYHRPPLTVALEQREEQWALRFLSDAAAIVRQVRELWALGQQSAAPASPLSLPESVMEEAKQARPLGETEIQKRLEEAGVPSAGAKALAQTLAHPRRNGALVALFLRQGIWDVGGLGMLEGENGLWLLRSFSRQQAQWIECLPRSGPQLLADVEALVRRFLPPAEV